jgi:predicted dehydrogenase
VTKVCIIGCGAIARRAHLPIFRRIPGVEIRSVVDTNEELARKVAMEFNVNKYYSDYNLALDDKAVDMVSICTPSSTHASIIIEAAKKGKNILVEKPLALSIGEGKAANKAVNDNGVKLCVVFNNRMMPAVRQMRARIRSGRIGRIVSMRGVAHTSFPILWTRSTWLYGHGGAIDDFGPHLIDLLLWLNPSDLESVSASGGDLTGDFGFVSHIQVAMKFADNSIAVALMSWVAEVLVFAIDIDGTAGRLSCDARNNHLAETHGQIVSPIDEFFSTGRKSANIIRSVLSGKYFRGNLSYHEEIIRDFLRSIEMEAPPPVSGEEALLPIVVSQAAKMSLDNGKTVYARDIYSIKANYH